jgi:hypothetical protein
MCSILTDLTEIYVGKPFQPKTQDRRKTRFSKAIAK